MGRKKDKILGEAQRLLVIRLSAMGDVAITVPILLALTRKYPQLRLSVLSKPEYAALFEEIPHVDFHAAAVKGKHNGIHGLYHLFSELKTQEYDAVADLHGVIRSQVLCGFFKATGVPIAKIDKGRKEKKAMTRLFQKTLRPLKPTAQRYADVFAKLGFPIDSKTAFFLPKRELTPAVEGLFENTGAQKFIGIAPFAAHNGKQYPLELVREVIATLVEKGTYRIFLFGGGENEVRELDKLAENSELVQNVAGRFDLSQELIIISNLDGMLAMDSGNGHLAAMYGVPVVTLWGVTHPYLGFVPYAQPESNQLTADLTKFPLIPTSVYGNKVPNGYENAIATIKPEAIIKRIEQIVE